MIIKKDIVSLVNNVESRRRISERLGIGDQMLGIHLRNNKPNGRLTKMDALQAISDEANIAVTEILESPVEEPQN